MVRAYKARLGCSRKGKRLSENKKRGALHFPAHTREYEIKRKRLLPSLLLAWTLVLNLKVLGSSYSVHLPSSAPPNLVQSSSVAQSCLTLCDSMEAAQGGQTSLSITNSQSLPKFMSIQLVIQSNHLILHCPLLLPPSIFPSIKVFSNESALCIRWPGTGV